MLDLLSIHRAAHWLYLRKHTLAARAVTRIGRQLFGSYIHEAAEIGPNCELGYGGIGVVVHGQSRIGAGVLISPGVVLGGRSELPGAPVIEDGVKIGAGAKILGPITVGKGARIGANAVVIHDVPAGVTVAGVPARPVPPRLHVVGPAAAG